jgi:DNA-binding XRE family transcriptional regulator
MGPHQGHELKPSPWITTGAARERLGLTADELRRLMVRSRQQGLEDPWTDISEGGKPSFRWEVGQLDVWFQLVRAAPLEPATPEPPAAELEVPPRKAVEVQAAPRGDFGEALRAVRTARGLSQSELGVLVGCTTGHICNLEAGRKVPSLPLLVDLADTLRLDLGELTRLAAEVARRGPA